MDLERANPQPGLFPDPTMILLMHAMSNAQRSESQFFPRQQQNPSMDSILQQLSFLSAFQDLSSSQLQQQYPQLHNQNASMHVNLSTNEDNVMEDYEEDERPFDQNTELEEEEADANIGTCSQPNQQVSNASCQPSSNTVEKTGKSTQVLATPQAQQQQQQQQSGKNKTRPKQKTVTGFSRSAAPKQASIQKPKPSYTIEPKQSPPAAPSVVIPTPISKSNQNTPVQDSSSALLDFLQQVIAIELLSSQQQQQQQQQVPYLQNQMISLLAPLALPLLQQACVASVESTAGLSLLQMQQQQQQQQNMLSQPIPSLATPTTTKSTAHLEKTRPIRNNNNNNHFDQVNFAQNSSNLNTSNICKVFEANGQSENRNSTIVPNGFSPSRNCTNSSSLTSSFTPRVISQPSKEKQLNTSCASYLSGQSTAATGIESNSAESKLFATARHPNSMYSAASALLMPIEIDINNYQGMLNSMDATTLNIQMLLAQNGGQETPDLLRLRQQKRIERQFKIERYKNKRRNWIRKISYDCRKRVADARLRVKGRFISKKDSEKLHKLSCSHENDIVQDSNPNILCEEEAQQQQQLHNEGVLTNDEHTPAKQSTQSLKKESDSEKLGSNMQQDSSDSKVTQEENTSLLARKVQEKLFQMPSSAAEMNRLAVVAPEEMLRIKHRISKKKSLFTLQQQSSSFLHKYHSFN